MICGYARVSTDGQSVDAQVRLLKAAGCEEVCRETVSGAKTDRAQLRGALAALDASDRLMVTRLNRLVRSTCYLLNTLPAIADKKAGFRSLAEAWNDTSAAYGAVDADRPRRAGGVRARANPRPHRRGTRPRKGAPAEPWPTLQAHNSLAAGRHLTPRAQRAAGRHRPQLQRQRGHNFETKLMKTTTI